MPDNGDEQMQAAWERGEAKLDLVAKSLYSLLSRQEGRYVTKQHLELN